VGGLAGGEAKREDCSCVTGGRDKSQDESADGINIVAVADAEARCCFPARCALSRFQNRSALEASLGWEGNATMEFT
jgi:hypothetical protein